MDLQILQEGWESCTPMDVAKSYSPVCPENIFSKLSQKHDQTLGGHCIEPLEGMATL